MSILIITIKNQKVYDIKNIPQKYNFRIWGSFQLKVAGNDY